MLLLEFNDAVHEGDGERLLRVWKFLLVIFRSVHKTKYSLEGLLLLINSQFLLPPRLKEQLLYSRFVNTRGVIPIDLHLEHVNRVVKGAIHNQVSNVSQSAILRTSRCTGSLVNVAEQFDKVSNLHRMSSAHSEANLHRDISRIVTQLHKKSKVYEYCPNRKHSHFDITESITATTKSDRDDTKKWMRGHLKKLLKH